MLRRTWRIHDRATVITPLTQFVLTKIEQFVVNSLFSVNSWHEKYSDARLGPSQSATSPAFLNTIAYPIIRAASDPPQVTHSTMEAHWRVLAHGVGLLLCSGARRCAAGSFDRFTSRE